MHPDDWLHSSPMCRLCLQQDGFMLGIFNHIQGADRNISKKISECTALQIAQGDGLPHIICHRCLFKIEFCLEFRQQCYVSDATLRRATPSFKDMQPPVLEPETAPEASVVMVVDPTARDYESELESEANTPAVVATLSNEPASDTETTEAVFRNVSMCTYCDRAFCDKAACVRHEADAHDPAAPFECGGCDRRFGDRVAYAIHVKAQHQHDKPYGCPECARSFARRSDLRKHTIVHTGVKPYTCPFCRKAFSRNTNLSKHIRIHTDQKTYSCHRCAQAFFSKADLARHSVQHTGAKPHVCTYCNVGFMRKDKLAKHVKRHLVPALRKDKMQELQKLRQNLMQEYGVPETYQERPQPPPGNQENQQEQDNECTKDNSGTEPPTQTPSPEKLVVHIDPFPHEGSYPECPNLPGQDTLVNEAKDEELPKVATPVIESIEPELPADNLEDSCKKETTLEAIPEEKLVGGDASEEALLGLHDAERPFLRRRDLVTHTGDKDFRCPKQFSRKDKLLKHNRMHANTEDGTREQCPMCSEEFQRNDALVEHMKIHSSDTKSATSPRVENVTNVTVD